LLVVAFVQSFLQPQARLVRQQPHALESVQEEMSRRIEVRPVDAILTPGI
jgi:hypothetical protein